MSGAAVMVRRKRGRPARKEEIVCATPETLIKLRQDPLLILLGTYGNGDVALERAADEIRAVFLAVCGQLMAGIGGLGGGRRTIPDFLAWAHAQTYLPWANSLNRTVMEAVIDILIDRRSIHPDLSPRVALALDAYARRMKSRPAFEADVA